MEQYKKIINGAIVVKLRNEIVLTHDGMQTINPSHEMLIANGWEEYSAPAPSISEDKTEKRRLVRTKHILRNKIIAYDSSNEVNSFYMGDTTVWLDKATRAGLMLRFQAEIAAGKESTTLWYGGRQYALTLAMAMQMLYAIELYASQCYDVTQAHLAAVEGLQTIEEVEAYEYSTGYPIKLEF